jgi:hypothetical protein
MQSSETTFLQKSISINNEISPLLWLLMKSKQEKHNLNVSRLSIKEQTQRKNKLYILFIPLAPSPLFVIKEVISGKVYILMSSRLLNTNSFLLMLSPQIY